MTRPSVAAVLVSVSPCLEELVVVSVSGVDDDLLIKGVVASELTLIPIEVVSGLVAFAVVIVTAAVVVVIVVAVPVSLLLVV